MKLNCLHEIKHPLIQHKLTKLRDVNTSKKEFKELMKEISILLAYEATKNLPLTYQLVSTPLETFNSPILQDKSPVIVSILRAGIGMVDGILSLIPSASEGHIGLFRDETTLKPSCYYFKIPRNSDDRQFFLCDPMLATGGSVLEAIARLKAEKIEKITLICIVSAPEGINNIHSKYPNLPIFTACVDRQLNQQGYILPGLGDAGDRLFGTK